MVEMSNLHVEFCQVYSEYIPTTEQNILGEHRYPLNQKRYFQFDMRCHQLSVFAWKTLVSQLSYSLDLQSS